MENEKTLKILPRKIGMTNYDYKNSFSKTKVEEVKLISHYNGITDIMLYDKVTTWSGVINKVIRHLASVIQEKANELDEDNRFENLYEKSMNQYLKENKFHTNVNFSKIPYINDSFIKSAIYKNSKNHKIYLYKDLNNNNRYICAPFTTEKIWSLQTILDTIYSEDRYYTIEVKYKDRNIEESLNTEVATRIKYNDVQHIVDNKITNSYIMGNNKLTDLNKDLEMLYSVYIDIWFNYPSIGEKLLNLHQSLLDIIDTTAYKG